MSGFDYVGKEIKIFNNDVLVSSGTVKSIEDYIASPSGDSSIFEKSVRYPDACRGYNIEYTLYFIDANATTYDLVTIDGKVLGKANNEFLPKSILGSTVQILFLKLK